MTGERMNQIYIQVCLGDMPTLKTEEERRFYQELVNDMAKMKAELGNSAGWSVPSE